MNWEILLKQTHFPGTWGEWIHILELPSDRLDSWIEAGISLLTVDERPDKYRSFSNILRSREADDFVNEIWAEVRKVNPELNWRTEAAKRKQLEESFDKLKGGFEDKLYTDSGATQTRNLNRERALDIFRDAAENINANRDINWDELEETLELFNDNRALTAFKRELGDDINRPIADNIPEGEYPRLNNMYQYYSQVGASQEYNINTITPELALRYLTTIHEPRYLEGNTIRRLQRRGLGNFPAAQAGGRPRRPQRSINEQFRIHELRPLTTSRGRYNKFTDIFKGILEHDLNDEGLGLAEKLTNVMRNRAVNRKAILDRIINASWDINQGISTKEEQEKTLGLTLPDMPNIQAENEEEFRDRMRDMLDEHGGAGERLVIRQMETKMANYKKGSTKLFRDFIMQMLTQSDTYKPILDSIWRNGYDDFSSNVPQDEDLGFNIIDSMPSRAGNKIPIRGLPHGSGSYPTKVSAMHEVLILNRNPTVNVDEWNVLIDAWFDFEEENPDLQEQVLFGDLLQVGDEDETELLRRFTDPFRKSIAVMFNDIIDGEFELENLTEAYTINLRPNINIYDLIKEIRISERAVTGRSNVTRLLQNEGSYGSELKGHPDSEKIAKLVNSFYRDIDKVVTDIREGVVNLVTRKLEEMIRLQAEFLQHNDTIYVVLFMEGFLRFGGGEDE